MCCIQTWVHVSVCICKILYLFVCTCMHINVCVGMSLYVSISMCMYTCRGTHGIVHWKIQDKCRRVSWWLNYILIFYHTTRARMQKINKTERQKKKKRKKRKFCTQRQMLKWVFFLIIVNTLILSFFLYIKCNYLLSLHSLYTYIIYIS